MNTDSGLLTTPIKNTDFFEEFRKIPRLNRDMVITEKIDGTNAQIVIDDDFTTMAVASRSRYLSEKEDNHGLFKWAMAHKDELLTLGPGRHYGEWWGSGIQRGYGLVKGEKRFSLFNTGKWTPDNTPACVSVVPVLYQGMFDTDRVDEAIERLRECGSKAAPGYMNPEGIVIFHTHANQYFKVTVKDDEIPKSLANRA